MSLLRFTARALRPTCSSRHFSTSTPGPTPKSSSNLPFFLGGAGIVGLAMYVYLGGSAAPFSTTSATTPKPKPEKSALGPERFVNLKLTAGDADNPTPHRV